MPLKIQSTTMLTYSIFDQIKDIQWNPSCEATPFAPEKWPLKRGGLLTGVEINTFMLRFTVKWPLKRGWPLVRVASQKVFRCIA